MIGVAQPGKWPFLDHGPAPLSGGELYSLRGGAEMKHKDARGKIKIRTTLFLF
ncbi:Hypothetical protein GbCGDNIH9_5049 [Granulibacter bethesdensis]|uniref:Uncharacterized protein n=1 Tax=Granulibacter bethesdensis TaxID=364410 RepID=A0AAC9KC65_9PROT|nr:Hypothetical protein GbCGDNIH9_5049 [Granulibacter bethesdensis]APH62871.1 Hypothetical protein GbCGDNIH8_5049 [Granulibacter bethesdensis]